MSCDGAEVSLVFEQNSKLSPKGLTDLTNEEFDKLKVEDNRRPIALPSVRFGTMRDDPCLAVADFLLAGFRQYAIVEDLPVERGKKSNPVNWQKSALSDFGIEYASFRRCRSIGTFVA